jgi:hypothetical protein
MKKLDSKIVKIQKIMGIRNLITEVSKKDVLKNKIGLTGEIADFFDRTCGGLAVIMFKKYLQFFYTYMTRTGTNFKNEKDAIDLLNKLTKIPRADREYLQSIMDWVRVGLNGRLNQYQDLSFLELYNKSKEWHDSLNLGQGEINYVENNPVVVDFRKEDGTGFYWADLETNESDEECDRMGHCGRTARGNNLYSLREVINLPGGKFKLNKSHLTASIGNDGVLYQLKGPKNSKPKEEFHSYILPLFFVLGGDGEEDDYLISGFGSEYASDLDFKITDLPDETIKQLYSDRPELFESYSLRKKLKELGLIEIKPLENFKLKISPDDISRYVDGDWVFSNRRWVDSNGQKRERRIYFFEVLLTDPWDLWDNYHSGDWKSSLNYHVNDENAKKIRSYLLGLSENPSEHEDSSTETLIDELDEDGNVVGALLSAENDAESDDYVNSLQDHLKDLLETYGNVLSLNDEGAEIEVNVQNLIDEYMSDDEHLYEIFDNCGLTNSECVFDEIINYSYFDKPKWNFDDRFYPDIDNGYFNEVLSDRMYEFIR